MTVCGHDLNKGGGANLQKKSCFFTVWGPPVFGDKPCSYGGKTQSLRKKHIHHRHHHHHHTYIYIYTHVMFYLFCLFSYNVHTYIHTYIQNKFHCLSLVVPISLSNPL